MTRRNLAAEEVTAPTGGVDTTKYTVLAGHCIEEGAA